MSSFAEEESRSISENVTWAGRHRYAQGIYHLPGLLLGYQHSPVGEIQVDEAGTGVVRFIYLLALAGKSSTDICRILIGYGIPSQGQSQRWEPYTFRSTLKNEKNMGDAILQKEITVDFLTKTRKPNEGEAPQYYVENGHPGIVSKSVWQEVQATWTDASHRNCTFSPIANKNICGDCVAVGMVERLGTAPPTATAGALLSEEHGFTIRNGIIAGCWFYMPRDAPQRK